jgi:hypothetical protein
MHFVYLETEARLFIQPKTKDGKVAVAWSYMLDYENSARKGDLFHLVSPLVCPKCRCPMNIISFIEHPTVVCTILKRLGIWESKARPPSRRNVSPCTGELIPQECLSWPDETGTPHSSPFLTTFPEFSGMCIL